MEITEFCVYRCNTISDTVLHQIYPSEEHSQSLLIRRLQSGAGCAIQLGENTHIQTVYIRHELQK